MPTSSSSTDDPDPVADAGSDSGLITNSDELIELLREVLGVSQHLRMVARSEIPNDTSGADNGKSEKLGGIGPSKNLSDLATRMDPAPADDKHGRWPKGSVVSQRLVALCVLGGIGVIASISLGNIAALSVILAFILAGLERVLS